MHNEVQQGSLTLKNYDGITDGTFILLKSYTVMSLSDTAIKAAKANTDKVYKLPDEKGMYLLIHPNGSKRDLCKPIFLKSG